MIRRAWKPITATAVLVGTPSYFYYRGRHKSETFDLAVKVHGPDGKPQIATQTFPLISMQAADARIRENATIESKSRPDGIIWKHTTASLASNDPIEDAHSAAIIQRNDTDPSAPGDLLFFAVMDGHSGPLTSRLLSKILINAVILELSSLVPPASQEKRSILQNLTSPFWSKPFPADVDPNRVSLAIQSAFTKLDAELISAPIRVLAANTDLESQKLKGIPDLSKHPLALMTMQPAISGSCSLLFLGVLNSCILVSGSCALMAVLDTAHRNLYVACTGDCRAVAGIWEETPDGTGSWRVEVLTEDQTGRNPKELARFGLSS
jgi:pyruvate dehydrogenase phosphatase